ncbi:CBS domain-containing protein, partial [Candidatus Bathyarchaeota archaeon]|nr:CBS domain-containing protein [Candidatus Bathyarchaeota archaeon]
EISEILKKWILEGIFFLTKPIEPLQRRGEFKPLKVRGRELRVGDIMSRNVVTAKPNDNIRDVAAKLIEKGIDHLPVVDEVGKLIGIVTSWDLAKAIAQDKRRLEEIMTRRVVTAFENESIDVVVRRMAQHNISGVPVIDKLNHVIGVLTTDDISRKIVGGVSVK